MAVPALLNYAYLSGLLDWCGCTADHHLGAALHATIVKNPAHFLRGPRHPSLHHVLVAWNSPVSMYTRCGRHGDAARVFDEMRIRDSVSWNSLIASSSTSSGTKEALAQFRRMLRSASSGGARVSCDHATFTTVLSSCTSGASHSTCAMVHGLVVSCGFELEVSVGNALVIAYFDCGSSSSAERAFHGMTERNIIMWTAMISGMARAELYEDSIKLFRQMRRTVDANKVTYSSSLLACAGSLAAKEYQQIHGLTVKSGLETNLHVESGLMDVYSKCGLMKDALSVFRSCRDLLKMDWEGRHLDCLLKCSIRQARITFELKRMAGGGTQQSLRKYLGALKDTTTVSLAKVNSDLLEHNRFKGSALLCGSS